MIYIGQKSFRLYSSIKDKNIDEPLFECDELLAPTIQILNFLGYKTTCCCSGHLVDAEFDKIALKDHPDLVNRGECYIAFEKSVEELRESGFVPISEAIPMTDAESIIMKQFVFRNEHGVAVLRRTFPDGNGRLFEMVNSAVALIHWAARLVPDNNKFKAIVDSFIETKYHRGEWSL